MTHDVFKFAKFSDFVKIASHTGDGTSISAEEWSKRLGYRSPQTVSMVLSGQRAPSLDLVLRMARELGLGAKEQHYLELLMHLEKRLRQGKPSEDIVDQLKLLNPNFSAQQPLTAAQFAYISSWYYLVVKQLATTPDFSENPEWIVSRLRQKISARDAQTAVDTLVRLGYLTRDTTTGKLVSSSPGLQTTTDVPNQAVRTHQKQMLLRAAESIDEQSIDQREVNTVTFKFDSSRMQEAKQALRKFRDWFDSEFEDTTAKDVFQLNVQFFSLTD